METSLRLRGGDDSNGGLRIHAKEKLLLGSNSLLQVNEKCNFFDWVDPEWDDRSFSALTKLMQKKDNAVQEGNSWKEEAEKLIGTNVRLTEELAEMKEELEKERAKADRGVGRDENMQLRDELKELKMELKKQKEAFNGVVKLVVGAMAFALVVLVVAMVLKV